MNSKVNFLDSIDIKDKALYRDDRYAKTMSRLIKQYRDRAQSNIVETSRLRKLNGLNKED